MQTILQDSQMSLVISGATDRTAVADADVPFLTLNALDLPGSEVQRPTPHAPWPDQLAYAIQTSGSTGKPKTIMATHRGLASLIAWHIDAFSITPADRASQIASTPFDASSWEVWPYICAGASVHG